ncbi:hypothetical protein BELL_0106g00110 [Botrytis elliptica]|uniref:Uncharacterized protein n=1 Tax=Botrytis elliptica TaxID=278938 RepID=A0A4Z1JVK5_9HELO|nr:hypothetical protein EAE99_002736 [Botrytis elliptica]TGO77476.1 hypothetical protein BELL_0106g00110 [Botrytis elliptica]
MFRRTLLRSGSPIIWRPHRQGNTADGSANHSGGQDSTSPQDQTVSLLLNQPKGNTLTNHGYSHDINSITVKEMLSERESRLQKLEYNSQFCKKKLDDIQLSQQKLKDDIKILQTYRDREYAGGVVSIRNQLAQMFLRTTQIVQRKQQIANPIDIRVNVYDQNELAYDVNLSTTINQADMHPDYFDICLDTVFGAPKNHIKILLEWDKTGENQVYSILSDHGEAWHKGFANTCPAPFRDWLEAIYCLHHYESNMLPGGSSLDHMLPGGSSLEYIRMQKEGVEECFQEWNEAYTTDRSNYGKKRKECQKIITEDYRKRGLIPRIKKNLFHGVKLDK